MVKLFKGETINRSLTPVYSFLSAGCCKKLKAQAFSLEIKDFIMSSPNYTRMLSEQGDSHE
jgi:hypothetical protein